ncbi:MAG: hypothetical protein KGO94_09035, partial [Alphaproteobacteria bacterium]|nr:hypothetical protein [Alphaproteobacteria bacterium]
MTVAGLKDNTFVDIIVTQWINGLAGQSAVLDSTMKAITNFGVPAMILVVVSQWWLGAPREESRRA